MSIRIWMKTLLTTTHCTILVMWCLRTGLTHLVLKIIIPGDLYRLSDEAQGRFYHTGIKRCQLHALKAMHWMRLIPSIWLHYKIWMIIEYLYDLSPYVNSINVFILNCENILLFIISLNKINRYVEHTIFQDIQLYPLQSAKMYQEMA